MSLISGFNLDHILEEMDTLGPDDLNPATDDHHQTTQDHHVFDNFVLNDEEIESSAARLGEVIVPTSETNLHNQQMMATNEIDNHHHIDDVFQHSSQAVVNNEDNHGQHMTAVIQQQHHSRQGAAAVVGLTDVGHDNVDRIIVDSDGMIVPVSTEHQLHSLRKAAVVLDQSGQEDWYDETPQGATVHQQHEVDNSHQQHQVVVEGDDNVGQYEVSSLVKLSAQQVHQQYHQHYQEWEFLFWFILYETVLNFIF